MSEQDPNEDPNRPQRPPTFLPPQPSQLLDADYKFTPYYMTDEEAARFPGHATPHLSNNLKHPPEEFAGKRNLFPASDPIMDARKEGGETSGQGESSKAAKEMSDAERHDSDVKEFSSDPPDALPQAQKNRWSDLLKELLSGEKTDEDPNKMRARGELRKLKKLADLASSQQE